MIVTNGQHIFFIVVGNNIAENFSSEFQCFKEECKKKIFQLKSNGDYQVG